MPLWNLLGPVGDMYCFSNAYIINFTILSVQRKWTITNVVVWLMWTITKNGSNNKPLILIIKDTEYYPFYSPFYRLYLSLLQWGSNLRSMTSTLSLDWEYRFIFIRSPQKQLNFIEKSLEHQDFVYSARIFVWVTPWLRMSVNYNYQTDC